MANVVAGLAAQLGLDTTEFKKGVREAIDTLQELKERIPEAISIAGFVEMTKKAMEYAESIVDTAKANEVATESILRLSAALEENGGDAENTGRIYSGFTQKIEAAIQGNATAQTSFAKLGVTLKDLRTLSEQDLFEKTISGLANMKDAAERNGLAFETLGKAIRGVDIKGLSIAIEENKGKFDKYAGAIQDAHDLSEKLKQSSHEFMLEFSLNVIPTLKKLYEAFSGNNEIMKDTVYWIGEFVKVAAVMVRFTATTIEAILGDLKTLWQEVKLLAHGSFSEIGKLWDEQQKKTDAMVAADFNFFDQLFNPKKAAEAKKNVESVDKISREVTASYSKQLLAAQGLSAAYEKEAKLALLTLQHKENATNLTKHEKEIQDEINKVIENRDKQLAVISQKIDQLDMTKLGSKEIKAALQAQGMEITILADKYKQETEKVVIANQKMRESFGFGWNQAFKQYQENALTAADFGKQSFQAVTSAMDSAIDNFVKKGKFSFHNFAQSVIQDLLAIQLKMSAMQLFSGASSGFLKGIGGFLTGLSGGAAAASSSSAYSLTSGSSGLGLKLPRFASGGEPSMNTPSIVGEQGPELFVPKTAGTIIPNQSLANLGTTNNVTNYNIQAIDTKSFEDRLYGSANAIWAANTYAQKNLAVNRSRT